MATEQMEMDVSTDDNDGAPSRAARLSEVEKNQNKILRILAEQKEMMAKLIKLVAVLSRVEDKLQDQKEKLSQMEKNQQQMEKNLHHFAVQIEHLQNGQMALF
ncbi:hypothetical protein niasHT_013697 [Heterodera trifolii]|uniref:Uncharacterized protein n=1 Tax=Heterodera trifolii TaxID=157864 RepID=A0ABD2LC54_9BILA